MKKRIISLLGALCIAAGTTVSCSKKEYDNNGKYIDLHLHLDGAITVEIAEKLAELQDIELPTNDREELKSLLTVPDDCRSLNDFLKCFDFPLTLMQTYEGLKEAAHLVVEDMKEQGVIYSEVRYAPQLHCTQGMTQEDAIKAVIEGVHESSIKTNIILCCMRGEGNEQENLETVELAKKYLVEDDGVVAIDLAGAEALYPTANYRTLFAKAKDIIFHLLFTLEKQMVLKA